MKSVFLTCALLGAASLALAEDKKPAPAEERAAPEQRRPLNLKLDNPSQYVSELPQEKAEGADGPLPSLGHNARPMPTTPSPTSSRPFPKDTERGER